MTATNNAQVLMVVNENTILGSSDLKSVTYNGMTQSTLNSVLGSFLYTGEII